MESQITEFITQELSESYAVKKNLLEDASVLQTLKDICRECVRVYRAAGKMMIAGNGGSAADAQHIAAEFVGRFYFDRPSLPALALTTDTSMLTAIGNDYGYNQVFARQIQGQGVKGDIFVGISTSGNSPNIVEAVNRCREMGIITVGLTGGKDNLLEKACDYCIKVPSLNTPRIQEAHTTIGHIICGFVEQALFAPQCSLETPAAVAQTAVAQLVGQNG